jgi:hypothetical protein
MIGALYDIWLSDPLGNRIRNLTADIESISWLKVLGDVGVVQLGFTDKAFDIRTEYRLDRRIEVWRRIVGKHKRLVQVGLMRRRQQALDNGRISIIVSGPDLIHILARRVIEQEPVTAIYGVDRVMRTLVDECLGSNALRPENDITHLGFSLGGFSTGPQTLVTGVLVKNKKLLAGLQELSAASSQLGNSVYFDMIHPTTATFSFQTYNGIRGVDRTTGRNRKVIAAEFDNIDRPQLIEDRTNEATAVVVLPITGGIQYEDLARVAVSPFNRIVRTVMRPGDPDVATDTLANAALKESAPVVSFSGDIKDVPGNRFGIDWDYGDRLLISFRGEEFAVEVTAVAAQVSRDGQENLAGRIRQVLN